MSAENTLDDHALQIILLVARIFPPADMRIAVARHLYQVVKDYLLTWRRELKDLARPDGAEANQAGKDLTLLTLKGIHPSYVESTEGGPHEVTAIDLTITHLQAMLDLDYSTGEDEIYETALEGTQLLKALGESSEFPHPYAELPYIPALHFPLTHNESGETIWMEIAPTSHGGISITAHERKPASRDVAHPARDTALGGVHLAPQTPGGTPPAREGALGEGGERLRKVLRVHLYDGAADPYHWPL